MGFGFLFRFIYLTSIRKKGLVGCYADNSTDRDLNETGKAVKNINPGGTIESCLDFCLNLAKKQGFIDGYEFFGVQNR